MFCEHCGNKVIDSNKFCTKCGQPVGIQSLAATGVNLDQKWWLRLAKVVYILFYIPLPFVLYGTWTSNDTSYFDVYGKYTNTGISTPGAAFWYSLLALAIYMAVVRLIKTTFLYVVFGQKAEWRKEIKKIF